MAINTSHVLTNANSAEKAKLDFSSRAASFSESTGGFQSLLNSLNYNEKTSSYNRSAGSDYASSSQLEHRKAQQQPDQKSRPEASGKKETDHHGKQQRAEQKEISEEPNASNDVSMKAESNKDDNQKVIADKPSSEKAQKAPSTQFSSGADTGKTIAVADGSKLPAANEPGQESTVQADIVTGLDSAAQSSHVNDGEQINQLANPLEAIKVLITGLEGQLDKLSSETGQGAYVPSVSLLPAETFRLTEEINAGIARLQQWLKLQTETAANSAHIAHQAVDPQALLHSIREVLQPLARVTGEADLPTNQTISNLGNPLDSTAKSADKSLLSELTGLTQLVREFRAVLTNDAANTGNAFVKTAGAPEALMNGVALNNSEAMPALGASQITTGQVSLDSRSGTNISRVAQSVAELAATVGQQNPATPANPRAAENTLAAGNGAAALQRMASSPLGAQSVWADEVQGSVKMMLARGLPTAELQLKPASLGALSIRIESGEEGSLVQFSVQSTIAREQIEMHLPRLRELFAASQLELGDVSVSSEEKGENTEADQENNSLLVSEDSSTTKPDQLDTPIDSQLTISSVNSDGLLDVYA